MKNHNKLLAVVALLFGFFMPILAQNGRLTGRVTDKEGVSAPYVSIQLKGTAWGQSTDSLGRFDWPTLPEGAYTLVASFVGYKTLEKSIRVEAGKTLTLSLELFENAEQLREIVVKGYVSPNERVVSASKIAIKPMDLPQSIVSIDRQVLENQQVLRMSDLLMNTNGVYITAATGGYQEEIGGRGFSFGSSNTFKNGMRYFNGVINELSGLERVEVLKGSTAILFGNVAAGGVLNLVTKKPKFGFGGEVSVRTGSFGLWKPSFDVYGGIGKSEKMAYRLNGSYETAQSFRQGVASERYYINPSFLFKWGKKNELLIEADYLNDQRTPDFGAGIINYQIVDIPRERFLGVAWSQFKATQAATTAVLSHRFSDKWQWRTMVGYRHYDTDLLANTRPNTGTPITANGTWIRNIQRSMVTDNYYLAQTDINGDFKTGSVRHQFLLGADADQFRTATTAFAQFARYDTVNIFTNPTTPARADIPTLSRSTLTNAPIDRVGVYVQDLLHLNAYFKLLLGVRYSYQQTVSTVLTYSTQKTTTVANFDGAFSPRFGLVYQPHAHHALFASYANSFTLNTGTDINGNALSPSTLDQYELGSKNEFLDGKLTVNATLYHILNDNLAQISLENGNTNSNIKELAGAVQSQGAEIDIVARPVRGLSLMAGYSFNETKYVRSNTYIVGSLLRYNPNHTANMSAFYQIDKGRLKGLSVGATGVYIGKRYAGRSTRVQVANDSYKIIALPAYCQVDINVGYTYKNAYLRAKLSNLTNVLSYNVHDDNSVNPIAPRQYAVSLGYKF